MTTKLKVQFSKEKETPGAVRFLEDDLDTPKIRTLYVRKTAFAGEVPSKLTVTLEY